MMPKYLKTLMPFLIVWFMSVVLMKSVCQSFKLKPKNTVLVVWIFWLQLIVYGEI